MAAKWPTSVATDSDLYVAVNSLQTTLSTSLGTGDTSVVLASATGFPTAGGVTIDNEVIFYTGVSGATLTGCTRGADGTTAATHSVGVPVGASIIAFHHNGLMAEIEAIETDINARFGRGASSNAIAIPSGVSTTINSTGGLAITPVSNQLVLGATRTVTVTAPTPATSSRTWTIPDIVGNGTFAALEGTQTFSGAKTFSASATFDTSSLFVDATNHLVGVGTVNPKKKLAIVDASSSSTSVGSNPVLWIGGGNAAVNTLAEIGFTYGFTGAYTETYAPVTIGYQLASSSGFTKGDLVFATRNVTTDTQSSERLRIAADGTITATTKIVASATTGNRFHGDASNSAVAAGDIGEVIQSSILFAGRVSSTGTSQAFDVTSVALTAGKWLVSGLIVYDHSSATVTTFGAFVGTTSGNSTTGFDGINGAEAAYAANPAVDVSVAITPQSFLLSGNTTVYLKAFIAYTGGPAKAYGGILAIRVA